MKQKLIQFLLLFFVIFFILQILGIGKPSNPGDKDDIQLTVNTQITVNEIVKINIKNNTQNEVSFDGNCPSAPFKIYRYKNGTWEEKKSQVSRRCEKMVLSVNQSQEIAYPDVNNELFGDTGKYKIEFPITLGNAQKTFTAEFEIIPPGFFKSAWISLFYKPIYNTLILFISILPTFSNLGFAIILLTLFVKLLLLIPNNKAIKAQKKLQKVQPLIQEIQSTHKGNQQKIAEETMKIWKEHKVNPFGSCLPILIQFPIIIALFYVVRDGLQLENNAYLLYSSLKNIQTTIDPFFLNILDLSKKNIYVLPIIVGGLQFFQMKLSLAKNKKAKKTQGNDNMQMEMMNKTMIYVLPVMIAFFTASLPAAVGLYWGISTLFAIIQQIILNKKYE